MASVARMPSSLVSSCRLITHISSSVRVDIVVDTVSPDIPLNALLFADGEIVYFADGGVACQLP